ncbi:MAG TPA: trypsin-like serine protease [Polyangiaceae bacterium]|nr:trypsin-like serine protease [Polyangiaceae bacterium]
MSALRFLAVFPLVLAVPACGASGESSPSEEALGELGQAVQADFPFARYAEVITDNTNSPQSRSTGAIRAVNVDAFTPHANCGATFVSKHYAVTAAHCVDHLALNTQNVTIEEYRLQQMNWLQVFFVSEVSGNWPNWTDSGDMTFGYTAVPLSCRVKRRCDSTQGGVQNCPAGITPSIDIALLECPTRPGTSQYALTAATSDMTDVETWWFHEVLNLPTHQQNTQYWQHYGKYPPLSDPAVPSSPVNRADNWHYRVRHQLFALQSSTRPLSGQATANYRSVFAEATETWTDTPVCHGTSGAGAFARGSTLFYGPTVHASGMLDGGDVTLCHPMDTAPAGTSLSSHVRGSITHTFVTNSPEVMADR